MRFAVLETVILELIFLGVTVLETVTCIYTRSNDICETVRKSSLRTVILGTVILVTVILVTFILVSHSSNSHSWDSHP